MKSGRSGALKSGELGLSSKATKCSDLGVLATHETTSMEMAALQRTRQATASPGSDALAPPGSVGHVPSRKVEPSPETWPTLLVMPA